MGKYIFIFLIMLCIGFLGIYLFWPKDDGLPKLGGIDSISMETIENDVYDLNNGKIKLVMFYYTSCPDICPLTMTYASPIQETLKQKGYFGEEVEFVSITLDPEVDTPEKIDHYAKSFQADYKGWKWLRESQETTKNVADEFKMMYEKSKDGFVAHNTNMYLLDQENQIRAIYDMATKETPLNSEQILQDILHLVEK
jgi:protein SCO1